MLSKILPNLILFVSVLNLIFSRTAAASGFSDVSVDNWFYENVITLESMGIINGFPDGTFRPDEPLDGDQFIKMIVKALGHDPGNGTIYWASTYIDIAEDIGLLDGVTESNFKKPLPKAEIACIMSEALEIRGEDPRIDVCGLVDLFGYTPKKYIPAVLKVHNAGIITGYTDGTFRYDTSITRAEACTVTNKLVTPITRREHQITSLTPVPVCYSVNRSSQAEFLDKYEGNVNCLFTLQKISSDGIYTSEEFNVNINEQVFDTMLLLADNKSFPVIEFKAMYDKNIIRVDLFNNPLYSSSPDYAMFSMDFYDAPTGYMEKEWGYDSMFLKMDVNRLSDSGMLDTETGLPDVYYEYRIRGLMRLLFGIGKGDVFSDFILGKYTEFAVMEAGSIPEALEILEYGGIRLVFISEGYGRQLTFTFSEV